VDLVSGSYIRDRGDEPFRGVTFVVKLVPVSRFYVHDHGDEPFRGVTSVV
jgi:hypothetical protein